MSVNSPCLPHRTHRCGTCALWADVARLRALTSPPAAGVAARPDRPAGLDP